MKYLNDNYEPINESDIDLSKGFIRDVLVLKADAIEPDHVTKFAYTDDDYEMVKVYVRIPEDEPIKQEIQELKEYLTDTDYVVLKIAEGAATQEEYTDTIVQRKLARMRINELEIKLEELLNNG